ncbi:MAG TPA: selenide, water dikinase SelD, partial [Phycisphaerae bacterium]
MEALAQVLRQLPRSSHPNLLVGTEHFDDAGVYRLSDTLAIVQTVDFFPPLVDDPFTFGQIAAANSLSDIYAMGGQPLTALNIVGFPDKELDAQILCDILCGGAERIEAAGAVIVGGHSVRDAEVKYGLAVTGTIHPDHVVTNGGAQPGDVLVLTKPIGSAQLTTAAKSGKITESDLAEAVAVMIELNAGACQAMLEVGVSAATDITGFGLLGHAFEMADASGTLLEIEAAKVPLMNLALQLARDGVLTRAEKSNRAHLGDRLNVGRVDP